MALRLVPATRVLSARDEQHAIALFREAGHRAEGEALRRLAQQVVNGTLLLVRDADAETFDDDDFSAATPLLTSLMQVAS